MPPNTVKVDRTTRWGNPFDWRNWLENAPRDVLWSAAEREVWAKEQATEEFRAALAGGEIDLPVEELRGLSLACWCSGPRFSCHADVLLELANAPLPPPPRDEQVDGEE
jgi:hypothetical protein